MQELLCVKEVARMLAVSSRHVLRLCKQGHVPQPVKVGRATRWRVADIKAWIANGCPKKGDTQ